MQPSRLRDQGNAAVSVPPGDIRRCFHCGLDLQVPVTHSVEIFGASRAMCCAGCAAVAQSIVAAGLTDFYEKRENFPDSPGAVVPGFLSRADALDRPEIQKDFVSRPSEHEREAALILEGITCPACVWLNETHLAQLAGVVAVQINYTTRRARVRWDDRETRLSAILDHIGAIGYRAWPYSVEALELSRNREKRRALLQLAVAGLGMMQVMMYAVPAYLAGEGEMSRDIEALMRWTSFALSVPVVAWSASTFFQGAFRDLRHARVGMDVPVALGISVAFVASTIATFAGEGPVYFDSIVMFVFFLLGGRFLELNARHKAAEFIEFLSRSMPATASRLVNFPLCMNTEEVAAGSLIPGDRVLVRPGSHFPADGSIEQGNTDADESLLTGESRPVPKPEGAAVIGGTVNRTQPVVMNVQKVGPETMLSGIVGLMERAGRERPRIQEITDRVSGYFVAFVLLAAMATAWYWLSVDPGRALPIMVSVLVATCPCALSLATPLVQAVATATLARMGLIVTRARAIERLAKADVFVFDKTGTLTIGVPVMAEVRIFGTHQRSRALAIAAALEKSSEHPAARAIVAGAGDATLTATRLQAHAGEGIEADVEGQRTRIGNRRFVEFLTGPLPELKSDMTQVWLGRENTAVAVFLLEDSIRRDAPELIGTLIRQGARVVLASGDSQATVAKISQATGISEAHAGMSPDGKRDLVREFQAQGAIVAMIGDGVNDAPVLAQAQVSIAMGGGSALAHCAADMVLVSGHLMDLSRSQKFSKRALGIVRQNLFWAFAYNIAILPLAVTGWLTPWMAAIGMSASSLLVVLNALRARHEGRGTRYEKNATNCFSPRTSHLVPRVRI
ncbi:MAG: heavy metal translocating P-type ATPase [Burkholderiales bacterium]